MEGRKYQFGGKCIDFISYYQYSHPTRPHESEKNDFIFCYQYSHPRRDFFDNILKVVVLFEKKNWLGFYLKILPKIGVSYIIFPWPKVQIGPSTLAPRLDWTFIFFLFPSKTLCLNFGPNKNFHKRWCKLTLNVA